MIGKQLYTKVNASNKGKHGWLNVGQQGRHEETVVIISKQL